MPLPKKSFTNADFTRLEPIIIDLVSKKAASPKSLFKLLCRDFRTLSLDILLEVLSEMNGAGKVQFDGKICRKNAPRGRLKL